MKAIKDLYDWKCNTEWHIQLDENKFVEDFSFQTRRGCMFAIGLLKLGATVDQLNFLDCDDIVTCVVNSNPPSQRKAAMATALQSTFAKLNS